MEVLTLPEPGRTLFLKAQPVLIRGCGLAEQGKPPRSVFGGGTILAARWHHRESKDVDIRARLQGDNGVVSRLRQIPTMEQTWNQWLQEAGMTPLKWHSAYKVTAQLRGREGESEPKLEIGEFEAPLEEEATRAKVEEQHVRVASNASILAGKWWGRRTHAPVRDLYDIVVAGAKDPGALQRALQTGGKGGAIDEFLKNMIENREQYMRDAQDGDELNGTIEEYEKAVRNPAWWAGWTVARWAMIELTVEETDEGWKTTTLCAATPARAHWSTDKTIEEAARSAQWVGQLSNEERERLTMECRRNGGGTSLGKGAGIKVEMTRGVEVNREGNVTFTECGKVVAHAASVEEAAEVGVEQGSWDRKDLPAVIREMEITRKQAWTRGMRPSM